jgi:serine-type D-Ala-D-Ala endopeptidase (penicillin-binding protein 7)
MLNVMKKIFLFLGLLFAFSVSAKDITAESWLVADETGKIIQGKNMDEVRSIASISKLMTVMVVLDAKQNPYERIMGYTRNDRIMMALVKSDNNSATLLCNYYPGGKNECVKAMNAKAVELNMPNTKFNEATGLSIMNVSTATELIHLVQAAKEYPEILEASKSANIKIQIKKRWMVFKNTNPIIGRRHNVVVSKTGYIHASGGCIVMMLDTEIGRRIVVVLGSKNTHTRIPEAEFIAENF